jgi:hypothetical protein
MLTIIAVESWFKLVFTSAPFRCLSNLISTEYALNAVNQGVTALGIKGVTSWYQPVNLS